MPIFGGAHTNVGALFGGAAVGGGGGGSPYSQTRVSFDGTTDYISYTANASMAQSKFITVSFWIKFNGNNGTLQGIFAHGFIISFSRYSGAGSPISWYIKDTSNAYLWQASSTGSFTKANALTHIALTYRNDTGVAQFYVNGAPATYTNTVAPTGSGTNIWWDRSTNVGNISGSTNKLFASLGDFWVDNTYTDLSSTINSYYGGGTPPDLSGLPQPLIWLGGNMTATDWNAGVNRGRATMPLTMNGDGVT